MQRRKFIHQASAAALLLLAPKELLASQNNTQKRSREFVFIEAEQFTDHGGWELDQQSMDQIQ